MANSNDNKMPLPISFEDDKDKKGMAYRGAGGGTEIMNSFNQQIDTQMMRSTKTQQGTGLRLDNVQSQKPGFGHKYPVQIITLELDEAPKQLNKPKIEIVSAVESKEVIEKKEDKEIRYTNDLASYAVKDQTPEQVLSGLTAVLVGYSQDLDIRLNEQKNSIEGVVFVENYYGIKFTINIWADKSNKDEITTRFELVRTDGDAMATSKFLGDIKTQFFIDLDKDNKNKEKEPEFSLVSLSLDVTSLDLKELFRQLSSEEIKEDEEEEEEEEEDSITKKELDEVNEALSNNELESVDELKFLHERLKENGAISKDIVNHEPLVKTIIGEAMKNKDICVSRACLLILEQLCTDDKIGLLLVEQYALFDNLVKLLNHEFALIKNYSVRLLAKLSSQKKWNMNKDAAQNIEKLVKNYQSEWKNSILANNGFLKSEMFDEIYKKLSQCQ